MKKVMLVFGTRPEAIKMAPLVKAFEEDIVHFSTVVCVTGQHRDMLDQELNIFGIKPQYDLDIMQPRQDLYDITSRVLVKMRAVLVKAKPDIVLVHGDTTTSMAAALAAFYQQIPVGHVEAGLRTYDMYSPWPEEMNRQMTSRLATWHFAPTALSRENLISENISDDRIYVTGNTVIDALHMVVSRLGININANSDKRMVLVTGHRRENLGMGLMNLCKAMKTLAAKYPDVDFVYPIHPNPKVRMAAIEIFGEEYSSKRMNNIKLIEPLGYVDFIKLMAKATIVLTDSGGIQEEAPGLGKPVLVLRDTTERPEAVEAGTVKLIGANYDKIVAETSLLLDDNEAYEKMSHAVNPYGDAHLRRVKKRVKKLNEKFIFSFIIRSSALCVSR